MRRVISFVHISLDGLVAGPNGEMDWIKVDEEIFDFGATRIQKGDTAIYGRVTYEMMEAYWPTAADKPNPTKHDIEHSKWYSTTTKIVLSRTLKKEDVDQRTIILHNNLVDQITALKQSSGEDILVFGSPSATHSLMKHNLIDGYWLFVNPIVLGEGIPLFKNNSKKTLLTLLSTHQFSNGVTELFYVTNES